MALAPMPQPATAICYGVKPVRRAFLHSPLSHLFHTTWDGRHGFRTAAPTYPKNALETAYLRAHDGLPSRQAHQTYVTTSTTSSKARLWRAIARGVIKASYRTPRRRACSTMPPRCEPHLLWNSMKPGGGGRRAGRSLRRSIRDCGGLDKSRSLFKGAAVGQFAAAGRGLSPMADAQDHCDPDRGRSSGRGSDGRCSPATCGARLLPRLPEPRPISCRLLDHLLNWDFVAQTWRAR